MFIEVTDAEYNKKHYMNISSIDEVVDNNADQFWPYTMIEYKGRSISVKESYSHVVKTIREEVNKLSKGK